LFGLVASAFLVGCGEGVDYSQDPTFSPHTGNVVLETEVAPESEQPQFGDAQVFQSAMLNEIFYVYATQLRVRTSPEVLEDNSNVAGMLNMNDQVRVVGLPNANNMVQIEIVKTVARIQAADAYYVSKDYLSKN